MSKPHSTTTQNASSVHASRSGQVTQISWVARHSLILLLFAAMGFALLSFCVGGAGFGLPGFSDLTDSGSSQANSAILSLRMARTFSCFAVGAALAVAGLILQLVLDNPLAEPYTLGISGGATLGALTALLLGLAPVWVTMPLGSLIGCVAVTALLLVTLPKSGFQRSRSLVLFGLMISLFCGSFVVLLISVLEPARLSTAIQWTMGFAGTERDSFWPMVAMVLAAGLIWIFARAQSLDALLLGDGLAFNTKVHTERLRREAIVVVCLLTGCAVSLMGLIGFVGLIAPHLATLATGTRRVRKVALQSALLGGVLLLTADVLGRMIGGDREIPAGSLTALIGAPVLIGMMLKRWRSV